jgi:hypothetical protein
VCVDHRAPPSIMIALLATCHAECVSSMAARMSLRCATMTRVRGHLRCVVRCAAGKRLYAAFRGTGCAMPRSCVEWGYGESDCRACISRHHTGVVVRVADTCRARDVMMIGWTKWKGWACAPVRTCGSCAPTASRRRCAVQGIHATINTPGPWPLPYSLTPCLRVPLLLLLPLLLRFVWVAAGAETTVRTYLRHIHRLHAAAAPHSCSRAFPSPNYGCENYPEMMKVSCMCTIPTLLRHPPTQLHTHTCM